MSRMMPNSAALRQSSFGDQSTDERATAVDQTLERLRRAVSECGWTFEALEAAMGKDRSYIHRVLHGEKPMTFEFFVALPDDIEARFYALGAEHFDHIVVKLPASREEAQRDLVSGLLGLFHHQLPNRASSMAKAELPQRAAKVTA